MKRVISACLQQTIHFQLKDDIDKKTAAEFVKSEVEHYKRALDAKRTKYQIVDEKTMEDGSVIIKIKKQVNSYDTGEYITTNK